MRKLLFAALTTLAAFIFVEQSHAQEFKLTSNDISEGKHLKDDHVFQGFGCEGKNLSPHLAWKNAPEETKSFAVTVYDPDAPTGSGWWHWNVVNIPSSVSELPIGSNAENLPKSVTQIRNDYGVIGFGGACPPPAEVHRYKFTVHALGVEALELPENASNALAGFMIRANSLASDTITAVYTR